jgi:uncharacterized protein
MFLLSSCASYYRRNMAFQTEVAKGDLEHAEKMLAGDKRIQRDRNRLLYLLNMGFVNHLQGEYEESNKYFNEADLMVEDYDRNYATEALALVSNPEVNPYPIEDFETVMIHYYKALNYLKLSSFDAALVEARRMNLLLNRMNDRYPDRKNRYQADAFAHILIGLAYEASGDLNNAFIAYRNAYDVYQGEHGYFGVDVPGQLKKDLLRITYQLSFQQEYQYYADRFGTNFQPESAKAGEVVVLWHNGMGPVKDEWSINFVAVPGGDGVVVFENEELGLSFPFNVGDDKEKRNDLLALQVIRVAFPKYLERPNFYREAAVVLDNQRFQLEPAQNINAIAFKTLEDRFVREMGKALLRLATKKIAEIKLTEQNEALGLLATIGNAVTEKADTRNWQTLPHTIHYRRVPLNQGTNELTLEMRSKSGGVGTTNFTFEGGKDKLYIQPYHSLEHFPAAPWDRTSYLPRN